MRLCWERRFSSRWKASWGRNGFDGDVEAGVAGRGAAGLVKSGNKSNCQQRLRLRSRCVSGRAPDHFGGHVEPADA